MPGGASREDSVMSSPFPAIPYGRADCEAIRREGCLYVDKTRFLHALERERYAFLIRNTVLAHRGPEAYRSFTHGGGFYCNFFAALNSPW